MVFGLCLLCGSAGCTELASEGKHMLLSAKQQYDRGRYADANRQATAFLASYQERPESAEALYVRALARIQQQQIDLARADLHQALTRSKRDDLTANSHTQLALIAYHKGHWAAAANHFGLALERYDTGPALDEIVYRYGVALQRVGRWNEAGRQFAKIVRDYRGSPFQIDAQRKLAWSSQYFSIQTGAFSDRGFAKREERTLREQGLDARTIPDRSGGSLWKVHVGKFATYDGAQSTLSSLRPIRSEAFIIP
jgi:tetratricopeptide (TPR) repeat protein